LHSAYELFNPGKNVHLFFNKFQPVNHMHHTKCGINSSLHNFDCCIRSVAPWITVLSRHTVFTNRVIYYKFTFVWYSTKQGTTHRLMSHLVHCALSLATRTQMAAELGGWFRWPVFVITTLSRKTLLYSEFGVSNQNFTDGSLLEFDFFPGHCNRHLQRSALFTLLCITWHSSSNPMLLRYEHLLQWQQNRSKAIMCLV